MHTLLAINWEPQLRGILIIIISTVVLCGSVYLIIGTNVGARLGFLISLASLAGWMMLMGAMWWAFGIGLVGTDSSWKPMTGAAILQDTASFREVGLIEAAIDDSGDFPAQATAISDALRADGWKALGESDTAFGQAASAGGFVIEADGTFAAGQYKPVNVFDKGGERYPKIGESIDFLAFKHKPRYVIVEIAPLVPQRDEPGRAPAVAEVDDSQSHRFVYLYRDLGHKRRPAAIIFFASGLIFAACCYLLHTRDRRVMANRSAALAVSGR